ncbi:hypothetical protein ACFMBG_15360 [Leisingera sp. D0M16]|uniref:hypothetical protein n=1 Tax=Leisingera coralii TaxID=3351347 RepID=UPI003B802440
MTGGRRQRGRSRPPSTVPGAAGVAAHYLQLLRYYRVLVAFTFVFLVGGTAAFSTLLLHASPVYRASAKVSLLPTPIELAYSQNFVRSTTINPANLLTQTHIEYLLSREIAAKTLERIAAEFPPRQPPAAVPEAAAPAGLGQQIIQRVVSFRRYFRQLYNTLNSGRHVVLDPRTDTVLALQDSIHVEMVEGTYIMKIKVFWGEPRLAAAAANFVAEEYVAHARAQAEAASLQLEAALRQEIIKGDGNFAELEEQISTLRMARTSNFAALRVIDPAMVPVYPVFPRVIVNTVFAFAGWIMASAFLVISADTFSRTVKTEGDLQRLFGPRGLGVVPLQRPSRAKLAQMAKAMNLQCNAVPSHGAVTAIGSDVESRRLTAVIEVSLRRLKGWQKLKAQKLESAAASEEEQGRGATLQAVASGRSETVVQLGRLLDGRSEPTPANGVKVTDLGGADESFCMSKARGFNWVVIGIRPGTVAEETLQGLTARLQAQGVENVFGVMLRD